MKQPFAIQVLIAPIQLLRIYKRFWCLYAAGKPCQLVYDGKTTAQLYRLDVDITKAETKANCLECPMLKRLRES